MAEFSFITTEMLHKSDTEVNNVLKHLYNLLHYMPDGYFPKDMSGTFIYDLFNALAIEFADVVTEMYIIKNNNLLARAEVNKLYNNFGILLTYPVFTGLQDWEDFNQISKIQGYRPGLILLMEGSLDGGTPHALHRVGHAVTGVAPLLKEFYQYPKWVLSDVVANSPEQDELNETITSMPDKYSITCDSVSWTPNNLIGDYIRIVNNSTNVNIIDDNLETFTVEEIYPIQMQGTRVVRVGNTLFGVGGVLGGTTSDKVYRNIIDTDLTLSGWDEQVALPTPVGAYAGVVVGVGNRLYVLGGKDNTGTNLDTVYYSNVIDNNYGEITSWTAGTTLPKVLSGFGCVYKDEYLYIIGGQTTGASSSAVYRASVSSTGVMGAWVEITSIPEKRGDITALVVGNYIYVFGGYDSTAATDLDTIIYAPIGSGWVEGIGVWSVSAQTLPYAASYIQSTYLGGYIYLTLGYYSGAHHGTIVRLSQLNNGILTRWGAVGDIGTITDGASLVSYNTEIYSINHATTQTNTSKVDTDYLIDTYSFNAPKGVVYDEAALYVVDTANDTVVKYEQSTDVFTNFHYTDTYISMGNLLSSPEDAVVVGNYLYIVDTGNSRIVKTLKSDLSFNATYGSYGTGNNNFDAPSGIATDGTYLYIADTGNNRINIRLASDLSFVQNFGALSAPKKVAYNDGNLYIANTAADQIIILTAIDATYVGQIDTITATEGVTVIGDYLYVSDTTNNIINRYNKNTLVLVNQLGLSGGPSELFSAPTSLVGGGEFLFVADTGNDRISIWRTQDSELALVISNTHDTVTSSINLNVLGAVVGGEFTVGKSYLNETTDILSDDMEASGLEAHFWGPFDNTFDADDIISVKTRLQALSERLKPSHTYIKYAYHDHYVTHMGQINLSSGSYDSNYLALVSGSLYALYPTAFTTYSGSVGIPSGAEYYSNTIDLGGTYADYDWYLDYIMRISNQSSGSVALRWSDYENYWGLSEWEPVERDAVIYAEQVKQYMQYKVNIHASGSEEVLFRGLSLRALEPNGTYTFEWIS